MSKEPSAIEKIRKLREEEAKLVETAKAEALAKTKEGIEELNALGFSYELTEPGAAKAPRKPGTKKAIDHSPKDAACPICNFSTDKPHDRRSHKKQVEKRPFTDAELASMGMKKVVASVAPKVEPPKPPEPEKSKTQAFM